MDMHKFVLKITDILKTINNIKYDLAEKKWRYIKTYYKKCI